MDQAFRRIYREQIETYRASQVSFPRYLIPPFLRGPSYPFDSLGVASEAMDSAISGLGGNRQIRPDARLFLLVNIHQLVTLPLSHPMSPTELDPDSERALASDVAQILAAAAAQAGDRPDIAASHVVRGAAQVLDKLHLKSWRLWERDER